MLDGTEREVLLVALVACCRDIDAGAGGKTPTCIPRVSPTYAAIATARTRDQVRMAADELDLYASDLDSLLPEVYQPEAGPERRRQ